MLLSYTGIHIDLATAVTGNDMYSPSVNKATFGKYYQITKTLYEITQTSSVLIDISTEII
jgi:hypothetical protein